MKSLPWNAWLLATVQPFVLSVGALNVFLGGIVGTSLHNDPTLATLPVTALILGVSLNIFPAARIQRKIGRKHAFVIAALVSSVAAYFAACNIDNGSFWGFSLSTFILGTQLAMSVNIVLLPLRAAPIPLSMPVLSVWFWLAASQPLGWDQSYST